jgi:hypothetical protein
MIFIDADATHLRFIETDEKSFGESLYVPADRSTWIHCMTYTTSQKIIPNEKGWPPIESLKLTISKIKQIANSVAIISRKR